MDNVSFEPEARNSEQQSALTNFLNEVYNPKNERTVESKLVSDATHGPAEKYDEQTSKQLDKMAGDVADLVAKNSSFGSTFRERDWVVGSALRNTFQSLGLNQSGVKELSSRINAELEKRGSSVRVDLEITSDGLDHGGAWNDRHRNIDMYIVNKEDFDKRDKSSTYLDNSYKDKALDRMQMHGVESREFNKDYDSYWRLKDSILKNGKFSGDPDNDRVSVKQALQDALNNFGSKGVRDLVEQLNKDLKEKGCDFHIDLSQAEKILSKPGWGHSGMGVLNVDLKIVDNNSKKERDSLTLNQHFAWGAPILPGSERPDPSDRFPDPGIRDYQHEIRKWLQH